MQVELIHQQGPTHCAAACLEMAYRAFGVIRGQQAIFDDHAIVRPTNPQEKWIRSHRIAWDAQQNGLRALAFKPRNLAASLRTCMQHDLLVILEQRLDLKRKSHVGHMRLCAEQTSQARFQIFDPQPNHKSPIEMTAHMIAQLSAENAPEITGLIVAIGNKPLRIEQCGTCATSIPWHTPCGHCSEPILLDLSALIGCPNTTCAESLYRGLTCSSCNSEPPN